jgi:CheY-like chemotaxis protein
MSTGDVPTVFIIDDDSGVRESVKDSVESVGLRAQSFATAQEFLSSERRDAPSCLVLDIRLPGISGLDLQHELKRAGVKIPIIFISGHRGLVNCFAAMRTEKLVLRELWRNWLPTTSSTNCRTRHPTLTKSIRAISRRGFYRSGSVTRCQISMPLT